jgi:AraC family transcriptional regulator
MSLVARTLWIIERNLAAPLSLADLADRCGVSRFHLAHAFGDATGYSVMEYVWARRLSEAAKTLAGGAQSIVEVAFASGYGSHEAFSRAFRARFGATPEAYRRHRDTVSRRLTEPLTLAVRSSEPALQARIERAPPVGAIGLAQIHSFSNPEQIPAQWKAFGPEIEGFRLEGSAVPIGLVTDVDDEGRFTYACAVEVPHHASAPAGLQRFSVPARTCAVFPHAAHISQLRITYAEIFDRWLPKRQITLAPHAIVERHDPAFDIRTGHGGLEIWVPITPRGQ